MKTSIRDNIQSIFDTSGFEVSDGEGLSFGSGILLDEALTAGEEADYLIKQLQKELDKIGFDCADLEQDKLELQKENEDSKAVIQKCFDDICRPSGNISKSTARELMKRAKR